MSDPKISFTEQLFKLCDAGWRPQSITSLLLAILRTHFSDPDNIQDPVFKKYPWSNMDTTGILIEVIAKWKPTLTEKRPAIIIKRNALKVIRQGINDQMMLGIGAKGTRDIYATFLQGSHTVFCIGGEGAETENLAAEVYRELIEFGPIIRKTMNLHRFVVAEIGELALLEEASENFVVPISTAYAFEEAWEITQATAKLGKVILTITN